MAEEESQSLNTTTTAATATTTNTKLSTSNVIHSPPTKLPSRPRKTRKLSNTDTFSLKPQNNSNNFLVPRIFPRSLSCEGELEYAIRYLKSSDPLLVPLIEAYPLPRLEPFQPPFLALTKSIIYQQLAFKAGSSIYTRFISLCGGESNVTPDLVTGFTSQQLRQIGVSARKESYLHDLSRKYQNGILSDKSILEMDDKSLFTMLTMVNGIGSWSVHTFMIFSLHRPDVLPIQDPNIRKGVQMLYGLEDLPRPSNMDHLCEKWKPYRSVASWYIWRYVEAKGANSKATAMGNSNVSLQQQILPKQRQPQSLQPIQLQQPQPLQQIQLQPHQQFLDPINGILNVEACTWGQ